MLKYLVQSSCLDRKDLFISILSQSSFDRSQFLPFLFEMPFASLLPSSVLAQKTAQLLQVVMLEHHAGGEEFLLRRIWEYMVAQTEGYFPF